MNSLTNLYLPLSHQLQTGANKIETSNGTIHEFEITLP
jgi:hypothetical protein